MVLYGTGYDNNIGQEWHLFTTTIFFRPSIFIYVHNGCSGINVQFI